MASKMAAKDEIIYCVFFSYINIAEIFMSEICLIAMNACFLYLICNFEIFLTLNSSMAFKMAAKMEILFIGDILQFFKKIITCLLLVFFDIT